MGPRAVRPHSWCVFVGTTRTKAMRKQQTTSDTGQVTLDITAWRGQGQSKQPGPGDLLLGDRVRRAGEGKEVLMRWIEINQE